MASSDADITGPFDLARVDDGLRSISDKPERSFGPYTLCYDMASGGMGTISLGRLDGDDGVSKVVAIKRIHPHLAQERKFVHMFMDEVRIASRIRHPNVCSVIDYGEVNGRLYMAMEYLAGVSFGRISRMASADDDLHRSRRWHAMACMIAAEAAEGLHAAHELRNEKGELLGIVHRDVSPDNVFVTFDGTVKILDFGIAFALDRLHHTVTKTLKGKIGYMAPEQLSGQTLDRRADVWSLGVCLWEALAGRRLFKGAESLEVLDSLVKAREAPIPLPTKYRAEIASPVVDALTCALKWNRDERVSTARELGRGLRDAVARSGETTSAADIAELLISRYEVLHRERVEVIRTIVRPSGIDESGAGNENPTEGFDARLGPGTASLHDGPEMEEHTTDASIVLEDSDLEIVNAKTHRQLPAWNVARAPTTPRLPLGEAAAWQRQKREQESSDDMAAMTTKFVGTMEPFVGAAPSRTVFFPALVIALLVVFSGLGIVAGMYIQSNELRLSDARETERQRALDLLSSATDDRDRSEPLLSPAPRFDAPPSPRDREPIEPQHPPEITAPSVRDAAPIPAAFREHDAGPTTPADARRKGDENRRRKQVEASANGQAPGDGGIAVDASRADAATEPRPEKTTPRVGTDTVARSVEDRAQKEDGFGVVNVVTKGGWADVYERGRHHGTTPIKLTLDTGRHVLDLYPFGREPARRVAVSVQRNKTVPLVVDLSR